MTIETAGKSITRTTHLIAPDKLGYTGIYLDFLAGRSPAIDFYLSPSIESVARTLDQVEFAREPMVDILRRQNEVYRSSEATMARIEQLRERRAVCVFAGQQAGLFGGPLLTLIKALAVVKAARLYSEQLHRPVIPMFWIAGDDHDFEEANHTFVLTRAGEICRATYQTPPPSELPMAEIRLDDPQELDRLKSQLGDCLGETDFTGDLFKTISRAYAPGDTMVTAFGKLMAHLTRALGLVLFSPGDADVKRLAVPFFKTVVETGGEIHDSLMATNQAIAQCGYHIQVQKKDNATHLFYNLDGRKPVMRDGDRYVAGESSFTRTELVAEIEAHPERFSPDVMTRPVLQSFLFPVVSQKGGPAEIAYLAQLNPLFGLFDLPAPVHRARPTMTIVERRTEQLMVDMGIEFEDLLGDIEQVVNRVLTETFPADLENDFQEMRWSVEEKFGRFIDEALDFDQGLKKVAGQTQGKIDYLLKGFESKLFAAHKKKSRQTRDRIYRINNALYPHRGLQERCLNISYFLARYGTDVIGYILDRMDCEQTSHQLISLSEYSNR